MAYAFERVLSASLIDETQIATYESQENEPEANLADQIIETDGDLLGEEVVQTIPGTEIPDEPQPESEPEDEQIVAKTTRGERVKEISTMGT